MYRFRQALAIADRRAVAPALGVVILFAISAVVATTVAGVAIGPGVHSGPPTAVEWSIDDTQDDAIVLTHAGGPPVDGTDLVVIGPALDAPMTLAAFGHETLVPGTTAVIEIDASVDHPTVTLLWRPLPMTDVVLARWEASLAGG